jgi:aminoglycoside 6'-N-acetyltransferase I
VFVVPSERRRGVLRALMTAAERWCDERDIPEMRLHNSASSREARDAWTSLGFEVVEEVRRREVHPAKPAANRHTPPRAHAEAR